MFDNSPEYKVYDCHAGDEFEIDGVNFKILSEQNPEFKYYNNQSMVIKMWDDCKSFVFLGDLGPEGGDGGGMVVASGTPEQVASTEGSYTGQYLKAYLK